jgi:hypothetical protein
MKKSIREAESEQIRLYMKQQLRDQGIDPDTAGDELRAPKVRQRIPTISVDITAQIRLQREGRGDEDECDSNQSSHGNGPPHPTQT